MALLRLNVSVGVDAYAEIVVFTEVLVSISGFVVFHSSITVAVMNLDNFYVT